MEILVVLEASRGVLETSWLVLENFGGFEGVLEAISAVLEAS